MDSNSTCKSIRKIQLDARHRILQVNQAVNRLCTKEKNNNNQMKKEKKMNEVSTLKAGNEKLLKWKTRREISSMS